MDLLQLKVFTTNRAEKSLNDRIFYEWLVRKEVQQLVQEKKELKVAKRNRKKSLNNINKVCICILINT